MEKEIVTIEESVTAIVVITTGGDEMITARAESHHLGVRSTDKYLLLTVITESMITVRAATLLNAADLNRLGISVVICTDTAVVVHIVDMHRELT